MPALLTVAGYSFFTPLGGGTDFLLPEGGHKGE